MANENWEATPKGGSMTITLSRASCGEHILGMKCLADSAMYGCGFQFSFVSATLLSNGQHSTTDKIVLEESERNTDTLTFPTIDVEMELQ